MSSIDEYLKVVEECLTQAANALEPDRKLHWLAIAETWLKLAQSVEGWAKDQLDSDS